MKNTKPLSEQVLDLAGVCLGRSGVRPLIAETWRQLAPSLPESRAKDSAEFAFSDGEWARGKADQRVFGETLVRLSYWLEGYEAASPGQFGFPELFRLVEQAVHEHDKRYWEHKVEYRSVTLHRLAYKDMGAYVIPWSQEMARGPRDYDEDARESLDAIADIIAQHPKVASCECHVGEHAATLQAHITLKEE